MIAIEKRKEYADGEIITCPRCGSDDLDCEDAPDQGKCLACGLEFAIRQVAVWEEQIILKQPEGKDTGMELDKDTIFVLTKEDVLECARMKGIPPEVITDEILAQVREGVDSGLECWSEVVMAALDFVLKS